MAAPEFAGPDPQRAIISTMSKRFLAVGGIVLVIPVLALALLRMRAASPEFQREAVTEDDPNALPEAIANLQRKIDSGKAKL